MNLRISLPLLRCVRQRNCHNRVDEDDTCRADHQRISTIAGCEGTGMSEELVLQLSDASHLFVAPRVDPLGAGVAEVLGIAGVQCLLNELHMDKQRQRASRLVIELPQEKAHTADSAAIALALRRHVEFRLADERRELRNTYRNGLRALAIATVLLAVCLSLSSLFASEWTEGMRPLIRKTFEYGFEIIGWVILWHPVDVLVFMPLAIRSRIAALNAMAAMNVIVRAGATRA